MHELHVVLLRRAPVCSAHVHQCVRRQGTPVRPRRLRARRRHGHRRRRPGGGRHRVARRRAARRHRADRGRRRDEHPGRRRRPHRARDRRYGSARGCVIGHGAIVHGACIGDGCLIGMHATLLDGGEIGEQSIVGAQRARAGRGATRPPRSCSSGRRRGWSRELTDEDLAPLAGVRGRYTARGRLYTEQGLGADLSAFRGWRPAGASTDRPRRRVAWRHGRHRRGRHVLRRRTAPRGASGSRRTTRSARRSGCSCTRSTSASPACATTRPSRKPCAGAGSTASPTAGTSAATPCASRRASPAASGARATWSASRA